MKPFPAGMQWVKGAIQHVHHNIVLGQSDQPHKMWMNAVEETNNANLFRSQAFSFNSVKQWFHPWSFWLESGRGRLLVDLQCWRLQSCAGARSPLCRLHWIGIGEQGGAANLQPTYFILKPGSVATSLCIIACVMWQKPDPFWSVDLESSDFPAGQPETFLFPALHGECSGSFSGWARKRRPIPKASHWRTWVCLGVPKKFEEEGQGPEWPPPHPMAESQGRQCPKRPGHGFERSSLDLFSSLVVPNYWVCQVRAHRLGEGRGWAIERGRLGLDFKFGGSIPLILT